METKTERRTKTRRSETREPKQTKGPAKYTGAHWALTEPESAPSAGPWPRSKPGRWVRLPEPASARSWFCYKVWAMLLSPGPRSCPASWTWEQDRSLGRSWLQSEVQRRAGCSHSGEVSLNFGHPVDFCIKELNCYLPFVPVFFPMRPLSAALYEGWPDTLLALAGPCLSLVQFQHWL